MVGGDAARGCRRCPPSPGASVWSVLGPVWSVLGPGGGERLLLHAIGCKSPWMTVTVRPQPHSCLAVVKVLQLLVFLLASYNLRKKETAHDVTLSCGSCDVSATGREKQLPLCSLQAGWGPGPRGLVPYEERHRRACSSMRRRGLVSTRACAEAASLQRGVGTASALGRGRGRR